MTTGGKNKWLYIAAGLIITANIITLAMMWMHNKNGRSTDQHEPPGGGSQTFDYLSNELKFDQQQKDTYSLLRDAHHASAAKLEDSLRQSKDALFDLLAKDGVTEEEIISGSAKSASFNLQLDTLTFHHFQQLRAVCTPEQQKKFDEIISEAIRNMARGPGPGNHPGPGREGGPGHPPPPGP